MKWLLNNLWYWKHQQGDKLKTSAKVPNSGTNTQDLHTLSNFAEKLEDVGSKY